MKTASVREIRNAFPRVLQHVKNGHTVAITSRRKVVATLSPPIRITKPTNKPWSDIEAHFAAVMDQAVLQKTGAELLADDRDRY